MGKARTISKRLRFEVFKRDGFRCIYCGATPLQSELHADHVVAVACGGKTSLDNLVTSCADCNLGKSAVPLERRARRLDLDPGRAKDHAEQIKAYLKAQETIVAARLEAVDNLAELWESLVGPLSQHMYDRIETLLGQYSIDVLTKAMNITRAKMGSVREDFNPRVATDQAKYFYGVLRGMREQGLI